MLKNLVVIDALSVGAWIGILCGAVVLSAVATFFIVKLILGSKTKNADHNAQQILRDAQIKAERITKNAEIDAKQAAFEARQQADNDIRARKGELAGEEQKLSLREQAIDQRDAALVQKENTLDAKNDQLTEKLAAADKKQQELDAKINSIIAELEKVSGMKCIHLPVQSGNDEILKEMGRRYTREQYLDLVRRIREKIPGVAITTDIIVGFPNESLAQFEDTLSLCQIVNYDAAFTFIYSPRKGTPAAAIKDNVSDQDKHARFDRLLKVIEASVMSHSALMLGRTYNVLVDGPSKKDEAMLSGYTESNKLVNFKGPEYLRGLIVPVKIIEDHAFSMIGELVEDPILSLTKALASSLKQEPVIAEFLATSAALEQDPSILALRQEIKEAERQAVSLSKVHPEEYLPAKKKYDDLMKRYHEHPLVKNYEALHDEVAVLLKSVSEALQ